jgi:hypothetical protein
LNTKWRELLAHVEAFLSWVVTAHETWVCHFEPETKRQSMEWHCPQFPQEKKFKKSLSVCEVMITVFWDCEGVILVDVMPRREAVNSDPYIKMLTEFRECSKQVQPHKNPMEILHQHDSARVHTGLKTLEAITKFG